MRGRVEFADCVLFVALFLGAGCGERGQGGSGLDDVETIPETAIQVVGSSDLIRNIVDVALASDRTIWILNAAEPYFIAMAPDGSVIRTWGRRGGGPGELRNPNTLVPDVSGPLWVFDRSHHAFLRVDGPEDAVETIAIPAESIPAGRIMSAENLGAGQGARAWIRGVDSGFLLAVSRAGSSPFTRLWNSDIVRLTRDGTTEIAVPIADHLGDPGDRFGQEATEFLPFPLWALCPNGSTALYSPLSNSVLRLSRGEHAAVDSAGLPPERGIEMTMDRIFRMAYGFMQSQAPAGQRPDSATLYAELQGQWSEMQTRSATVFPEYADLHCTEPGTLWLQRFDPDRGMMGRGPVRLRIGEDDRIRTIRFPDSFRPLRFESTRALGVHRDDLDIESVAWMMLPASTSR
ncbi:MAG: hypothetical protein L0271_26065 [Gemmatimonadetes bacterium]|nr:hypothetical protein [Gemmatimonadota bacterium]